MFNIVEFIDDDKESGFNQTCKYGHLVAGHAVYCHNDGWADGPRKCHRTWYTGGAVKDEDCEGFEAASFTILAERNRDEAGE